ncbi:MAG TPA: zinc-ribbon domain-containing protein [Myxococcota bacterium]|nr:zinc-ribbon domain-containing protein [Myxococcota bacterium]
MIAACPRCAARYRIEKDKLRAEGVKLRCSRCQAVFRVRAPEDADVDATAAVAPPVRHAQPAPEPAPAAAPVDAAADLVLVALPDAALAKRTEEALRGWGLRTASVTDGVEAMLEIQRQVPRAALLSAALPRMYGFQICEIVKRNESLREIGVVLIGSIHHPDRYRRPPNELYGADAYVEEPDLPDALRPALERLGLATRHTAAPAPPAERRATRATGPVPAPADDAPTATRAVAARPPSARPQPRTPAAPAAAAPAGAAASPALAGDGLDEQRAKAERLARIIVSDIVLYNEEKFAAAVRSGNVLAALGPDLEEGRSLFRERIDARVRAERDHLADELMRVARSRS